MKQDMKLLKEARNTESKELEISKISNIVKDMK